MGCPALDPYERLLLWSMRAVVLHGPWRTDAERAWLDACGPQGAAVAVALKSMLGRLSDGAACTVSFGAPCRRCITSDEWRILRAVRATGRAAFDDAHLLLEKLVRRDSLDDVTHAAELLAEALIKARENATIPG